MTKEVLERHIQLERGRRIHLDDVLALIRSPDYIYKDGRPSRTAKGAYYAVKLRPDPHGNVKMKRLIAHLKRCRKLFILDVSFISTVILAKRLPPKALETWRRPELSIS